MTAALFDVIADWFAALRPQTEGFAQLDLEPEEDLFDPSISPLEEFH